VPAPRCAKVVGDQPAGNKSANCKAAHRSAPNNILKLLPFMVIII
jgi:hypothetical protein